MIFFYIIVEIKGIKARIQKIEETLSFFKSGTIQPKASEKNHDQIAKQSSEKREQISKTYRPITKIAEVKQLKDISELPTDASQRLTNTNNQLLNFIHDFLMTGNTIVRLGIIVLFFGMAFLLKYAVQSGFFPTEIRLISIAAVATVMFLVGLFLKRRRLDYALSLQGGGLGILYLLSFATFYYYDLITALGAFVGFIIITIIAVSCALWQDSMVMAVLGLVGGFLAPVLIPYQQQHLVLLFSYYLILNAAIFIIAWLRAWRLLNLIGFIFTFFLLSLWYWQYYLPKDFFITQLFLLVFFLLYLVIPILYAYKIIPKLRGYVDPPIVFGTPFITYAIQGLLFDFDKHDMAMVSLAYALCYAITAYFIKFIDHKKFSTLRTVYLFLSLIFLTMALPLLLTGIWSSIILAFEGAILVWVGIKQKRYFMRLLGGFLPLIASVHFFYYHVPTISGVWSDGFTIGNVLIALTCFIASYLLSLKYPKKSTIEQTLSFVLFAWGLVLWLVGWSHEINEYIPYQYRLLAVIIMWSGSCLLSTIVNRILTWQYISYPIYLLLPVMYVIQGMAFLDITYPEGLWIGWLLSFVTLYITLYIYQNNKRYQSLGHSFGFWLLFWVIADNSYYQVIMHTTLNATWAMSLLGIECAIWMLLLSQGKWLLTWPLKKLSELYVVTTLLPLIIISACWILWVNITIPGDFSPFTYMPILNPIDIASIFIFIIATFAIVKLPKPYHQAYYAKLLTFICLAIFVWINCLTLRTIHHWYQVPFTLAGILDSTLAQASLSMIWIIIALVATYIATIRSLRTLWFLGAILIALTVIKLFVMDLQHVGTLDRIVAFIGVGTLLLIIGYIAPIPPRKQNTKTP